MTNLVEVITELPDESFLPVRPRQEPPVVRQSLEGTKESQPLDDLADERIHRHQTFGFQLSEGHMDGPLIRAGATQAIRCQISAFADAHAGMANQEEDIPAQVIAAEEFLLQE